MQYKSLLPNKEAREERYRLTFNVVIEGCITAAATTTAASRVQRGFRPARPESRVRTSTKATVVLGTMR